MTGAASERDDRFEAAARALLGDGPVAAPPARNQVHDLQAALREAVEPPPVPEPPAETAAGPHPAGACLDPLLSALEWAGETRHLFEAMPHFDSVDSIESLRAVLSRLNIETRPRRTGLDTLPASLLPCLYEDDRHGVYVLIEREPGGDYLVFDGAARGFRYLGPDEVEGTAYWIARQDRAADRPQKANRPWFEDILSRFRSTIAVLFVLSFVINVLSLLLPVYVMQVYDKVIGARSLATLMSLLVGIAIAIGTEFWLRRMRTRALAFLGGRFESLVSIGVAQQLLYLPIGMTETVSAGNQITRLKQFESVREAFVGSLGTAILDLPFVLLFCAAVFVIGGPLGWIPVTMVVLLLTIGAIASPISTRLVAKAADARTHNRNALMELTQKHGTIRGVAGEDVWTERYRDVAASHFHRQFQAQQFSTVIQTVSQSLVMLSGVTTLFLGTHMVLAGELTVGAMIAIMALVWRVLSPLQAAFTSLNRIGQLVTSIRQINRMMLLPLERRPGQLPTIHRRLKGHVEIAQVSFKYTPRGEPVLRGVTLDCQPGRMIAVTGGSGAGKSTLLKIIAGLYKPQAGAVFIDGLDLRQINVGELRAEIGFAPQYHNFFYGTLLQNIHLAHPGASREECLALLDRLGATAHLAAMPDGLDTRINGKAPPGFDESFRQQLSLARAFIKDASVYLLDEPGRNLDEDADQALMRYLEGLKGRSTVVMVTHRPSHMRLADVLVVMRAGQVVAAGPPDEILEALSKAA